MQIKLPINYHKLSIPELVRIRIAMETEEKKIQRQIQQQKKLSPKPAEGFGSDEWLTRAEYALSRYQLDIQRINLVLLEQHQAPAVAPSVSEAFIQAARRRLDRVVFEDIMNEAKEEIICR